MDLEFEPGTEAFLRDLASGELVRRIVEEARRLFLERLAEKALEAVRANIANADQMGFQQLSDLWSKKKDKERWAHNMWSATGTLAERLLANVDGDRLMVGWDDSEHPIGGTPLAVIAQALELGVADLGIPERPVLRPALREVAKQAGPLMAACLREAIAKAVGQQ